MRVAGRRLLLAPLIAYVIVVACMTAGQRALVFPGFLRAPEPIPEVEGVRRVDLAVPGGTVPALIRSAEPMVVWFHGNGEQLADVLWVNEKMRAIGKGFAAVDYPGYGYSVGAGPSEAGMLDAGRALIQAVGARPECAAHSLGTGIAVAMAAEGLCSRLVLFAPYTSLVDVAAWQYPWLPVRWLLWDRMDSLSRAADVHVPTVILHGDRDAVVPVEEGRTLAGAIPGAKFVDVPGAGHGEVVGGIWP